MSISTVKPGSYKGLSSPDTFLDARCATILLRANQRGISGWVFDIPTGENLDLDMDITDHYVESGSFINDHAVEKPIMITLTGMIGELVYSAPESGSLEATLSNLSTKLGLVPAYLGPFTPGMTQKLAVVASAAAYAASQATAIEKRATNLIRYFKGEDSSQSLQEKAFRDLSALWKSKQVVTVQTPWGFFGNMMIKTISPKQDQQSNDYTDFSITLKEVRFVDIKVTTFDSGAYMSAIDVQAADAANIGPVQGEDTNPDSLAIQYTDKLGITHK